jgi:hypothetical protein
VNHLETALAGCGDVPADQTVIQSHAQALILWSEGRAVVIRDSAPIDLHSIMPVERAVMVARLRAVADVLEFQDA